MDKKTKKKKRSAENFCCLWWRPRDGESRLQVGKSYSCFKIRKVYTREAAIEYGEW